MEAPQLLFSRTWGALQGQGGWGLAFPFFCFQYTSGFYKCMVSIE